MLTDKSRSLQGIAVTLLLCAAILVFCSIPIAAKTSLTLSCWSKEEYWQPLIDRFESEYPNIEIELLQRPQKQYFDVVFTMLSGGAAPDLILSNPQYAPLFVAGGQWLDLGPYITRERFDFSQYLEPGWAYGRFNGTVYAWPAGIDPPFANHLFAYNKDYFQAAGVAEPDARWTFDDWLAMAKKLTIDENSDGVPEVYGTGQPTRNWWWNLVWSNGGRVFSDDKKQFRMIEHNATEALQFAYDLNLVHGVSGNAYYKDFHAGKAAIVNIPVAHTLGWLQQNPTSFDWGVTGYPRGAKAEPGKARAIRLKIGEDRPQLQ
jgi:multiple sugar transport system substrate-binding protein